MCVWGGGGYANRIIVVRGDANRITGCGGGMLNGL